MFHYNPFRFHNLYANIHFPATFYHITTNNHHHLFYLLLNQNLIFFRIFLLHKSNIIKIKKKTNKIKTINNSTIKLKIQRKRPISSTLNFTHFVFLTFFDIFGHNSKRSRNCHWFFIQFWNLDNLK